MARAGSRRAVRTGAPGRLAAAAIAALVLSGLASPAATEPAAGAEPDGGAEPDAVDVEEALAPIGIRFVTGFEYDRGDFGLDADTEIWSVPFSLRAEWAGWIVGVSTSWLRFEGPSGAVVGAAGSGRTAAPDEIDSGIGDTRVSLAYLIDPRAWADVPSWVPFTEAGIEVKIPTADEDELLGTGEVDVTLRVDLAQRFGPLTAFAGAGYRFVGGPLQSDAGTPFEQELDDIWLTSVGGSVSPWRPLDLGVVYDFRQSTIDGVDDAHEIVVFGTGRVHPQLSLGPYAVVGFGDNSPEFGLGLQLIVRRWIQP